MQTNYFGTFLDTLKKKELERNSRDEIYARRDMNSNYANDVYMDILRMIDKNGGQLSKEKLVEFLVFNKKFNLSQINHSFDFLSNAALLNDEGRVLVLTPFGKKYLDQNI